MDMFEFLNMHAVIMKKEMKHKHFISFGYKNGVCRIWVEQTMQYKIVFIEHKNDQRGFKLGMLLWFQVLFVLIRLLAKHLWFISNK